MDIHKQLKRSQRHADIRHNNARYSTDPAVNRTSVLLSDCEEAFRQGNLELGARLFLEAVL